MTVVKDFWNRKILGWEEKKYSQKFLLDVNVSLKYRFSLAVNLLERFGKDKIILELGCGSCRLIPHLDKIQCKKYIGIDVSSKAIDRAKTRLSETNCEVEFYCADISEIDLPSVDICFSLGLFDWLSIPVIKAINHHLDCKYFFHSFSEDRRSFQRILHQIYVFMLYGHKTKQYVPQYYTQQQIKEALQSEEPVDFFHMKELSFGCFAYHLPKSI